MKSGGKGVVAGAVVVCIVLFIGMCLFIASYSIVEPTYMAISRNKISSRIDDTMVYFEGRHFLGVSNEFIYYPMAWQLVEFTDDTEDLGTVDYICRIEDTALDAATAEGLPVAVELSLYFTIPPRQLINFYTTYGVNYQDSLANECKKVLKDCVTKFTYKQLFSGRLLISKTMTTELEKALARRRCVLQKLLLRGMSFSDSLENNIEASVVKDQGKAQEEYTSMVNKIIREIDTLEKNYTNKISQVLTQAETDATVMVQAAQAFANSVLAESTSNAWKGYQENTGLDSAQLLKVQWARSLASASSADHIILGYDKVGSGFVQPVKETP